MISLLERGRLSVSLSSCIQRSDCDFPDTESTSPLRRNTDDDADPFAKSEDKEELEDNESVSTWLGHVLDSYTPRLLFEGGVYFTQSFQIVWLLFEGGICSKKYGKA